MSSLSSSLKRALHAVGSLAALAGIWFVFARLQQYCASLDFGRFDSWHWLLVAVLAFAYGANNLFLGGAWWYLLKKFSATVQPREAMRIYGISQLAKYLPGNVFHIAGRQAIGMSAGIDSWALAKSSVWELGLLVVAGTLFGALALPLLGVGVNSYAGIGLFVTASLLAILLTHRIMGPLVAMALLFYLLFLVLSGTVFLLSLAIFTADSISADLSWPAVVGAFVVAWLIGLVTPGAPAGVGIREAVLYFFLKASVQQTDLIMAVLLGRIVTVAGDFLFYLYATISRSERAR